MSEDEAAEPVKIPLDALDDATLQRVAEEIVTRDGTDYGAVEKTLSEKVERLLRELRTGRAALWFDPETETMSAEPEG
ncbi:MAG: YheU family protein [Actinomycetota bacterium]|nr:YheU family protein [Actinomycetota bacterium]